jgi:hypothetical protein
VARGRGRGVEGGRRKLPAADHAQTRSARVDCGWGGGSR